MNKYIFKLSNKIIDSISGFDLNGATADALDFDFLSRDEIEKYHEEKFRMLALAASGSKYYKNFKNRDINDFPLMKREEYIRNYNDMHTLYDQKCYESISSGSTGMPVKHIITKPMLLAKRASHQKTLRWYGLTRESREMKLGGVPCSTKNKIYYYLRNKRYFNSNEITVESLPVLVNKYNKFRPEILYGYPTTIERFLLYAYRANMWLNEPMAIICHAENLYDRTVGNFRKIFPAVKVVNQYWATEANIAVTCPEGNLHIDENTVICEVLNKDGRGAGDLYITNLFSYKVPIIRYCIGDKVRISEKPCKCGRNTKTFECIEGRIHEYLELANGDRFPITAIDEDTFYENLLFYQIVHYRKENRLLFRYIPAKEGMDINREAIKEYFLGDFGLSTEFLQVRDVEYSPGGKVKRMIVID